ncbi:ubiquitin carboxyl-hydrolase [Proteus mirabilis]|uniref:terminase small subunit-like protein n=1 Tax=Proteus mirabilis TaxID=584 RepID=UPI0019D05877|nr:ubiquitin carboxyl-hydrolase [Proteus mirabilis]MCI9769062.1 ubiquitin carboxyl-hydrolase [Proteus mirabilis]MCI9772653.1 ubiquitin carboxyl-hydrolase [Proteus mirabilis]MCI9776244.1 ubiquitin carboxyl-hydrolase [Proteus mirabilis]
MPETAHDICSKLAEGESLRSVCRRSGMPSKATVFRWLSENAEFRDQYAKATEQRADALFEEILEIADDVLPDSAEVAKAKLRIDTRKWSLARMSPKKYGDKVTQEITGADGGAIQIETSPMSSLFGK